MITDLITDSDPCSFCTVENCFLWSASPRLGIIRDPSWSTSRAGLGCGWSRLDTGVPGDPIYSKWRGFCVPKSQNAFASMDFRLRILYLFFITSFFHTTNLWWPKRPNETGCEQPSAASMKVSCNVTLVYRVWKFAFLIISQWRDALQIIVTFSAFALDDCRKW